MRAEEREDALAGIVRRGLLVSGSDEPAQDREQDRRLVCGAFGSVHAASLGRRISAGHEPGGRLLLCPSHKLDGSGYTSETFEMPWRQADVW